MEANPNQVIEFTTHHISSRPLFLLLLYYLKLLLQIPTIPFLEWIAIPIFCMLTASVYFFGMVIKGHNFAGLVALFSSFSINVVVGMYTAYYSNVMALSLIYLALAFLLLALRRSSFLLVASSCILSIPTIFIHPWTWVFIMGALCLFVVSKLLYIGMISHGRILPILTQLRPVIVFILVNIIADLLKTLLLPIPSGLGMSYDIANARIGLKEFLNLGFNLYFTFRIYAGGCFNNYSTIFTAIIGNWYLIKQKGSTRGILITWLSLSAVPTLFVDFWANERLFYNLPLQILSTTGLLYLSSIFNTNRKYMPKIQLLVFILLNLNYALRSVANLV